MKTLDVLKTEIVIEQSRSSTIASIGLKRLVKYTTVDNSIYFLIDCINYNHGSSDTEIMSEEEYNKLFI